MRCMNRNKLLFYYAPFLKKVELADEYGNKTGEYELVYGNPVKCFFNVSAAQGETQSRQFGESVIYDRVIVCDKPNIPIDEYSILWVDTVPEITEDGSTTTPYDYIVKEVAKSINSVAIAISKVVVRE